MNAQYEQLLLQTRRHFFRNCQVGLGAMALGSLLRDDGVLRAAPAHQGDNPLAPKPPHFSPKAKRGIFLFMAGGPSQLELFVRRSAPRRATRTRPAGR